MTQKQDNVAASKQEQIIEDAEIAINSITDTLSLLALEELSERLDIKKRLVDIMIENAYKDLRLSDSFVEIIDEATKINREHLDEVAE